MWAVLKREFLLMYRQRMAWFNPLLFYILIALLFPFAISPSKHLLQQIGVGVIWIGVVLAVILSLPHLFKDDVDDGSLDLMLLTPRPLAMLVYGKVFAHWLMFVLPLLIVTPLLALLFHLSWASLCWTWLGLLLGSICLLFLGALGAALTVGLPSGGVLLSLLLLPLYIPILIYGVGINQMAVHGFSVMGPLLWLLALVVLCMSLVPWAVIAILRMGLL